MMRQCWNLILVFAMGMWVACATPCAAGLGASPQDFSPTDLIPISVSEDGRLVLLTNTFHDGLWLMQAADAEDASDGAPEQISTCPNAGYYASISPGNRYVCFKSFLREGKSGGEGKREDGGRILQAPMLYDIAKRETIACAAWSRTAGTPAVAPDGKIAFTVGNQLIVENADFSVLRTFDLGHAANLIAFSPDAQRIAFPGDGNSQISILDLTTGAIQTAIPDDAYYWGPQFSPAGDKLAACGADGEIVCADLTRGSVNSLGRGESPAWIDNDTISFVKKTIRNSIVVQSEFVLASADGKSVRTAATEAGDVQAAIRGGHVFSVSGATIRLGTVEGPSRSLAWKAEKRAPCADAASIARLTAAGKALRSTDSAAKTATEQAAARDASAAIAATTEITGVPYLHQVYDTLDTFCGSWACGASSAIMAIQYYNILPAKPYTVSYPSKHTSNYGYYVSEIYTFNGHTYNLGTESSCGVIAYGGYGYITQNDWEETRGHMAEYIKYHGPTSSVDWSATIAKARTEINASHPFVLLNTLTTAGHYICCIGYVADQNTLIFNDPYGNKNLATYPNYQGTRVFYDWPGANNGYQNLNTVPCFIYCRASVAPTSTPSPTPSPTSSSTPTRTPTPTPTRTPTPTPSRTPTPTPSAVPSPTKTPVYSIGSGWLMR